MCSTNLDECKIGEDREMTTVRRAGATSAATLCGLALTIILAEAVAPEWTHHTGLDVWNLPTAIAKNKDCAEETAFLIAQERQLAREIELGEHICFQVIDGSLSLAAAVDEMEPVLCKRTGFIETAGLNFGVPTIHLAVARYLIKRISRILQDDVKHRAEVIARVEEAYSHLG
jgi:hypothetical protein